MQTAEKLNHFVRSKEEFWIAMRYPYFHIVVNAKQSPHGWRGGTGCKRNRVLQKKNDNSTNGWSKERGSHKENDKK